MPTYDYQCPDGHLFERFQKITDRPGARCPECGRRASRRISGGAGLIFKGSGFYITDYGKDGKGPRKGSEGDAKPEAAPDAAPAADAAAKPAPPADPAPKPPGGRKKKAS